MMNKTGEAIPLPPIFINIKQLKEMSDYVRFELLGGSFKTFYGRDNKGKKVYYDLDKAKKAGIPEDKVLRWSDGMPIGAIELAVKGKRILTVHRDEEAFIESLKNHELVMGSKFKNPHAKVRFVDEDANKAKTKEKLTSKKTAMLVWFNLDDKDKKDFATLMGYGTDEVAIEEKSMEYIDKYADKFMAFFTEPTKDKGQLKATLKERYKVEAIVRRAMSARVVTSNGGVLSYKDKVLGSSLENAVNNLMNSNKGDEKALAFVLPLISDELGNV